MQYFFCLCERASDWVGLRKLARKNGLDSSARGGEVEASEVIMNGRSTVELRRYREQFGGL